MKAVCHTLNFLIVRFKSLNKTCTIVTPALMFSPSDVFENSYKPGILFMGHSCRQTLLCDTAEHDIPSGAILFA